jgi:hypothetical protein
MCVVARAMVLAGKHRQREARVEVGTSPGPAIGSLYAMPNLPHSQRGRQSRADTSAAWHAHYFRGEVAGSIKQTDAGGYEARDRRQNAVGQFDSWSAAAKFLERGASV